MKNLLNSLFVIALLVFTVQCTIIDEEDLVNPNAPSPDAVDPNFLLNSITLTLPGHFEGFSDFGAELTRMEHMFGATYENAYQPQSFDGIWTTVYATMLNDIKALVPIASERQLFVHAGIARVIKAYILINMVDYFGDVPLSQALDAANFNPAVDEGSAVYDAAFAELDSALIDLGKDPLAFPASDPYFGDLDNDDQVAAWARVANTLKAKILFQRGDLSGALNILNNEDVIDAEGEEWVFRYSTNATNPDSRHPKFTNNYLNGAGEYMANYYMNELWQDKSAADPRIRYYLYRQVSEPTADVNELECINNPPPAHYQGSSGNGVGTNDPFCEDWNDVGYWGRDHGNDDGIPPDNFLRTTFGVYPAGGRYDAGQAEGTDPDHGLRGAGIQPIWMPFYTTFMRAEIEETQAAGSGRASLEAALNLSIDMVVAFGEDALNAAGGTAPTDQIIQNYVDEVLARYDAAASADKLGVIAKEYYLALFGNGIEAYNLYRRTTYPRDIQPNLSPSPGTFIRSFEYPADVVETNSSIQQKPGNGVRVFWDDTQFDFDF